MNREIKFRIWNRAAKAMYPAEHFGVRLSDGMLLQAMSGDRLLTNYVPNEVLLEDGNPVDILMQFTGLLIQGQELFEGDLIADPDLEPIAGQLVEVVFRNGAFMKKFPPDERDGVIDYAYFDEIDTPCYKIYGNIFQNPEFLNPKP